MKYLLNILTFLLMVSSIRSQNIGIGTPTPTRAKFELHGMVGNTSSIFGANDRGIALISNWPEIGFNSYYNNGARYLSNGYAALQLLDPIGGTMIIEMQGTGSANSLITNPARAITITNAGNVGIRHTNPTASLTVGRGDGDDGTAVFEGLVHASHFNYSFQEDTYIRPGQNGGQLRLNQIPGGNVFFGNGSSRLLINLAPYVKNCTFCIVPGNFDDHLSIIQEDRWSFSNGQEGLDLVFNITNKGYFDYDDGAYHAYSDRSLKKNITPLHPILNKLKQLNPVSYLIDNKNPLGKRTIGFNEEEVNGIFPNLVKTIPNPDTTSSIKHFHSVSNASFSILAIKALQEQYEQIKILREEQAAITKEIEELYLKAFSVKK